MRRGLEVAHQITAREVCGSNLGLGRRNFFSTLKSQKKLRLGREPGEDKKILIACVAEMTRWMGTRVRARAQPSNRIIYASEMMTSS